MFEGQLCLFLFLWKRRGVFYLYASPDFIYETTYHILLFALKCSTVFTCMRVCPYLATWHYPVSDGQKRQPNGDSQHCPALHSDGLLPQTREVLVPDSEQLLLTIGMSDKLGKKHRDKEDTSSEKYM